MAVIAIVVSALSSSLAPTVAAVATPVLLVAAPLLLLTDDEGPGGPEALAAPIAGVTLAVGLVAERDVAIGLDAAVILTSVVLLRRGHDGRPARRGHHRRPCRRPRTGAGDRVG